MKQVLKKDKKRITVIFPLWKDKQHLGRIRIERFIRWLRDENFSVTIICAGNNDRTEMNEYGDEIILYDPIGAFTEIVSQDSVTERKPNKLRSFFAKLILIPDYGIIWGWRVYFSKKVRSSIRETDFIISSSSPESPHIVSYRLAKKYKKKSIVDLRDGWLDDPLRSELKLNSVRIFRESLIERRILKYAYKIIVTSSIWKEYLLARYKDFEGKVSVITNSYPLNYREMADKRSVVTTKCPVLLYLGRLSLSRSTQKIEYILKPLFQYSEFYGKEFEIRFVGKLADEDIYGLERIRREYVNAKCRVVLKDEIPKTRINEELKTSDGLLLLCISKAAIPSKFYDYIPTLKPILAITPEKSAVWNAGKSISQVNLIDPFAENNSNEIIGEFVNSLNGFDIESNIPVEYGEEYLSRVFINRIINNESH